MAGAMAFETVGCEDNMARSEIMTAPPVPSLYADSR
jgi:hypothetical protein